MKWKCFNIVMVCCCVILFPFYAFAEFQLPEDPVKNIQTFTGCIEVADIPVSLTPNLRIITHPIQNCKSDEIKIQFQANRIGELDPIGRVRVNDGPMGDLYQFSQYIQNDARLNTTTASGRTPTSLGKGPVVILLAGGSPASEELNQGLLNGRKFDSIEISGMAIPGYGVDGNFPILKVILSNAKVIGIKKIYAETEREEMQLSYERILWELQWFDIYGGSPPRYYCEYNTINDRVDGDDFASIVTAYKTPQIVDYPNEFLFDYFEQNLSNPSPNTISELSFIIQKDVDPATIANLIALINGQLIEIFNIEISGGAFQHRDVSVGSVEIRFDAKASVMEKVVYRAAPVD